MSFGLDRTTDVKKNVFFTFFLISTFFYLKNVGKWHIHIIKQQMKISFLLLCNNVDKRHRPTHINIVLQNYNNTHLSSLNCLGI